MKDALQIKKRLNTKLFHFMVLFIVYLTPIELARYFNPYKTCLGCGVMIKVPSTISGPLFTAAVMTPPSSSVARDWSQSPSLGGRARTYRRAFILFGGSVTELRSFALHPSSRPVYILFFVATPGRAGYGGFLRS